MKGRRSSQLRHPRGGQAALAEEGTRVFRVIGLPALGRSVGIGAYVAAVKRAKANPDAEFKHGLTTWWPTTGAEVVRQFRAGMHERINAGIPYARRGKERSPR